MYYPEELVEEIRAKNDIVDVISGYVRLQKKGGNHWGLCPFHNEKTPSFSVSGSKQMYHCFGCGQGGNVFTFLMKYENYTFPEAIKALADRAGVSLPEIEYSEEQKRAAGRRDVLLEINREAARFFYYQLRSPRGRLGYDYLTKRQLSEETMKKFGLGYAGKNGAELVAYLRQKGYEDQMIKDSGLAVFSERMGLVSQFWNRVMFPIQDGNHRVIGFGGRVMGDGEPKYLNSPETYIFDKRRNLYGLNFARTARSGNVILCEGYMDVIALHQAGFTQAVASLGTAFTSEQANLLHRYTESVLLAYDSDGAGRKAALRAIGILREVELVARVIDMRPYKDPDEFIKNLGTEAFRDRMDKAENGFFFEISCMEQDYNLKDPEEKTRFHREIARKLCGFTEDVERENYLQAVAEKYFIGFENLRKLVVAYAARTGLAKPVERRPRSGIQARNTREESGRRDQRLLITWIAEDPGLYGQIEAYLEPEDFEEGVYRRVAERLFAGIASGGISPAAIISMFEDEEEQRQAAELFNTSLPLPESEKDKEKAFRDILIAVKRGGYDYHMSRMGRDVSALEQVIKGKKALEEMAGLRIRFTPTS